MRKLAFYGAAMFMLSLYAHAETAIPSDPVPPLNNTLSEANNTPATVDEALPAMEGGKDKTLQGGENYAWNNRDSSSDMDQIESASRDSGQDEPEAEYYE